MHTTLSGNTLALIVDGKTLAFKTGTGPEANTSPMYPCVMYVLPRYPCVMTYIGYVLDVGAVGLSNVNVRTTVVPSAAYRVSVVPTTVHFPNP